MNVGELIERLEGLDPSLEVRLTTQPQWPLEFHLGGVVTYNELELDDDPDDPDAYVEELAENVVWLVEGGGIGYGSKAVFQAL